MTTHKSQRAMKDSGIAWVGLIPSDWQVLPFFACVHEVSTPNRGLKEANLLSLSYGRIIRKDINRLEGLTPASFEGYNIIEANDIVFRLTDLQNDQTSLRSAISPERGIITSAYTSVRPKETPRFFNYLMRAYDTTKVFYGIGGGIRQSMKFDDLKRLPVAIPGEKQREAIANHLDRETIRVDNLIARKTRFIELLAEKRQALITHAVTKGLNPSAKMKDSGVKWLGEIPGHWKSMKIRPLADKIGSGKTPSGGSAVYVEEGIAFLRSQNIYDDGIRLEDAVYITTEMHDEMAITKVRPKDVLLNITGGSIGRAALVPDDFVEANVNQHVCIVRLRRKENAEWVHMAFRANSTKSQIDGLQVGANREGLNFEQVGNLRIALPPPAEMQAILLRLKTGIAQIDALAAKTERSIELLREHRTALITAAVTGKIDLREAA